MFISTTNIIESVCNPSGRFKTISDIFPEYDDKGDVVFSCTKDMMSIPVKWNGKDYILKTVINDTRFTGHYLRRISSVVQTIHSQYLVDYLYFGNEMLVFDDAGNTHYCDVVLMGNPRGVSLERFCREKCDAHNIKELAIVRENFCEMALYFADSRVAHGRVRPENIVVKPNFECCLVNYEWMSVPTMETYEAMKENDVESFVAVALFLKVVENNPYLLRTMEYIVGKRAAAGVSELLFLFRETACKNGYVDMVELIELVDNQSIFKCKEKLASFMEYLSVNSPDILIDMKKLNSLAEKSAISTEKLHMPLTSGLNFDLYDQVFPMEESLHSVSVGDKWGYIDGEGNWVIEPVYDWADDFAEGRAVVIGNDCYGLIDKQGNLIMPLIYEDITWDCDHQVVIAVMDGKAGLFDRNGNNIVPFKYDYVGEMSCGLMAVSRNGMCGYINKKGDVVIDFIFDYASDFVDDAAFVIQDGMYKTVYKSGAVVDIVQHELVND